MKKTVYLARFGKVHGPFSDEELASFQASGKIHEYTWMWNHSANAWRSLDPAPAPLFEAQEDPTANLVAAKHSEPAPTAHGPSPMDSGFPATRGQVPVVCHNFRQVISGFVQRMTATGCELNTTDDHLSPTFVNRAAVILNLLDGDSGKLMNVAGRVCNVERTKTGWTYQVRWDDRSAQAA
jgi:hypothetical protein